MTSLSVTTIDATKRHNDWRQKVSQWLMSQSVTLIDVTNVSHVTHALHKWRHTRRVPKKSYLSPRPRVPEDALFFSNTVFTRWIFPLSNTLTLVCGSCYPALFSKLTTKYVTWTGPIRTTGTALEISQNKLAHGRIILAIRSTSRHTVGSFATYLHKLSHERIICAIIFTSWHTRESFAW
jgi:hypothetical protein